MSHTLCGCQGPVPWEEHSHTACSRLKARCVTRAKTAETHRAPGVVGDLLSLRISPPQNRARSPSARPERAKRAEPRSEAKRCPEGAALREGEDAVHPDEMDPHPGRRAWANRSDSHRSIAREGRRRVHRSSPCLPRVSGSPPVHRTWVDRSDSHPSSIGFPPPSSARGKRIPTEGFARSRDPRYRFRPIA